MKKRIFDNKAVLIEGTVFVIIGLVCVTEAIRMALRGSTHLKTPFGPDQYIAVVGFILIILGLAYLLSHSKRSLGEEKIKPKMLIKTGSTVLIMAAYIVLIPVLGYILATAVFFLLMNRTVGVKSWVANIITTILCAISLYAIFVFWLGMVFPRGSLFG